MSTVATNKLKVKDIITVVLLALINVVIFFASSLLYATPITIILMPVFFALLEGVVYFMIGTKVKKPGACKTLPRAFLHMGAFCMQKGCRRREGPGFSGSPFPGKKPAANREAVRHRLSA